MQKKMSIAENTPTMYSGLSTMMSENATASEMEDLRMDDLIYQDEMEYRQKVHDAGFDSAEEYEAYWKHLLETAEREHYNG